MITKLFWRELQVNGNNREPLVEEEDALAAGFAHEAQALLPPGASTLTATSSWTQCHFDLIGKPFHLRDHFRGYFEIANGHSVD